jgi:hypothetical protein
MMNRQQVDSAGRQARTRQLVRMVVDDPRKVGEAASELKRLERNADTMDRFHGVWDAYQIHRMEERKMKLTPIEEGVKAEAKARSRRLALIAEANRASDAYNTLVRERLAELKALRPEATYADAERIVRGQRHDLIVKQTMRGT